MVDRFRAAQWWLGLVALAAAAACGAQAQPAQGERASTIILLDGSNSMNARLPNDKAFKFVTVREALRASLPKVTAGTEVGLAAFGARRASDCTDAEVIVQPSPDTGRVTAALERFQPRGFSPVVLALRAAAKALPSGPGKASIVLVLDDLASCRGEDPCAVAAELKRQNPALAIHIVGLALRPADQQVLACVARQTGGQLFAVPDGPGVASAVEQALRLASLDRPLPAKPVQTAPAPTVVRPDPASRLVGNAGIDERRPGLHLSARLAEGRPLLLLPVHWRVWRRVDAPRPADGAASPLRPGAEPLVDVMAPTVSRQLPNGAYEIEARAGLITMRQPVEIVAQGPMPVTVNLNAALLAIAAPQAKGLAPPSDVTLVVYDGSAGSDSRTRGAALWIGSTGTSDLVVPAGTYRIRATAGLASAERVVAAGTGTVSDIELALASGRLVVEARGGPAAEPGTATQLSIEADDPDNAAGRRELYRAAASRLELTLPAGSYVVALRRGGADLRERVQIKSGETLSRAVALPLGRVRLVGRAGSGLPVGLPVSYRIERIDGPARPVQRWSEAEPVVDLTPGRYRFEARIGAQNAVSVREADIRPGIEHRIELDTGAGGVQLKLAGAAAGLGLGEVYWQIFDDQGAAVWRTGQAEPLLALGAGRYRVRAEVRDRTIEHAFDVRAGETRVVEVGG